MAAMKPAPSPGAVPAEHLPEPAGEERAGDAEQDGDDAAARVAAGHQQLGHAAGQAADDDPAEDSVVWPSSQLPLLAAAFRRASHLQIAPTRACDASATVSRKALAMPASTAGLLREVSYWRNTAATNRPSDSRNWAGNDEPGNLDLTSSDTLVVVDRSRRRRHDHHRGGVLIALIASRSSRWSCSRSATKQRKRRRRRPGAGQVPTVTVVVPGRSQVARTITASGPLAAKRDQPVGIAGQGGRVVRVLVDAGSWVRAGQTLAVIDRSVQAQQAAQLAAQVDSARANAALAQSNYERAVALQGRGFVSKAEIDSKKATRDAAYAAGARGPGAAQRDARRDRPAERRCAGERPDPRPQRRDRPDRGPGSPALVPPRRGRADGDARAACRSRISRLSMSGFQPRDPVGSTVASPARCGRWRR